MKWTAFWSTAIFAVAMDVRNYNTKSDGKVIPFTMQHGSRFTTLPIVKKPFGDIIKSETRTFRISGGGLIVTGQELDFCVC